MTLTRRKGLPPVNRPRQARKYVRNFAGPVEGLDYGAWVRRQPCLVAGCRSRMIQAAHVFRARGMGGAGGDWRELGPLCARHHREQEAGCLSFLARHGDGAFYARFAALLPAWIAEHGLPLDARGNPLDKSEALGLQSGPMTTTEDRA